MKTQVLTCHCELRQKIVRRGKFTKPMYIFLYCPFKSSPRPPVLEEVCCHWPFRLLCVTQSTWRYQMSLRHLGWTDLPMTVSHNLNEGSRTWQISCPHIFEAEELCLFNVCTVAKPYLPRDTFQKRVLKLLSST